MRIAACRNSKNQDTQPQTASILSIRILSGFTGEPESNKNTQPPTAVQEETTSGSVAETAIADEWAKSQAR